MSTKHATTQEAQSTTSSLHKAEKHYHDQAAGLLAGDPDYAVPDEERTHRISVSAAKEVEQAETEDQPQKPWVLKAFPDVRFVDALKALRLLSEREHAKPLAKPAPPPPEKDRTLEASFVVCDDAITRVAGMIDGNNPEDSEVKARHAAIMKGGPSGRSRPAFQTYLEGLKSRILESKDEELIEAIPLLDGALATLDAAVAQKPGPKPLEVPLPARIATLALHLLLGDLLRHASLKATRARLGKLKQIITPRRGSDANNGGKGGGPAGGPANGTGGSTT